MIQVIRIVNPFDPRHQERTELQWRAKKTLADYFPVVEADPVVVSVSGRVVQREQFSTTYLDKTDNVVLCPIPAGGGGSKQILMIVALIAVSVITAGAGAAVAGAMMGTDAIGFAAAYGGLGVAIANGVVTMAGSLLVNAIFAPPAPSKKSSSATTSSYGIDGAKNTSVEGIPVPVCYGSFRTGGNILGLYTENGGDDTQTLYMLLSAGEGPIASISDIEINDNPLTDYHDIEVQTRLGLPNQTMVPWFNDTIVSVNKGQKLTTDWFYSTTTKPVDKVRLDFTAPGGLGDIDTKSGDVNNITVDIDAEYRKAGDATWSPLPVNSDVETWNYATYDTAGDRWAAVLGGIIASHNENYLNDAGALIVQDGKLMGRFPTYDNGIRIRAAKKSAVRRSYTTGQLDNAQYEIRVRRNQPKSTKDNILDEVYLTDVSEVTLDDMTYPNTALLALKIKLTDQISGLPTVTFMNGGRVIPTYNGTTWSVEATSNPAWIVYDMLTHQRYGGGMPAARLDLVAFQEFAEYCESTNLTWNGPIETETNVWDACQMVLRIGHSQLVPSGTRYTVITERPASPVMMFSVANMIQGSYKETWLGTADRANEIDVTFFDRTDKYKQRTIKVYDPVALSSGAPQRNSAITLYGVVDYDKAYREAQFQLNLNRFILKTVTFGAPLEAIACRVGDLILVQSDLTDWAQAGRFDTGSTTSVMNLDRPVTMAAGKAYSLLTARDAVKRATGTVLRIIGNSVYLQGVDPHGMSVKRVQVGGRDVQIDATFAGGIIVQDSTGINAGDVYSLWDTDVIEEHAVVVTPGTGTSVTLQTPLAEAPAQFTKWMFGEAQKVKKPFRVKSISGDTEYRRDIIAIEYREEVYDHDRYGSNVAIPTDPNTPIGPIGNLSVYEETYIAGANIVSSVVASWTASVVGLYGGADVYVERNDKPVEKFSSLPNRTSVVIPAVRGDVLKVRVVAFDIFNKRAEYESAPTATYTVIGEPQLDVGTPTGAGFVWSGRDCKINWRYNATTHAYEFGSEPNGADAGSLDPHFKDYQIKVYNQDGVTLRRTEYTTDNSYVYIFDKNFSDGLTRHLVFEIRMRDTFNNLGAPATLEASNPAPRIVSVNAVSTFESAQIQYTHNEDPDFSGAMVWVSQNQGNLADTATPSDSYLVYKGPDTSIFLTKLMFNADYYFRIAAYDAFGPTELTPTSVQHFKTTSLDVAAIADGVLDGSKLIPELQSRIDLIDADQFVAGSVNARVNYLRDQVFNDPISGLPAAVAKITAIDSVSTTSTSANARQLAQTIAKVSNAEASITSLNDVSATSASAAAKSLYQVRSRLDNIGGTTIEQAFSTNASKLDGLSGQYTVKIDQNGYIAGFGLSSTTSAAGVATSEFIVNADKFGVIMPSYPGVKPFTIGSVGGVPRVILSNALIGDASISSAMIGDAQINSLKLKGEAVTVPVVSSSPDKKRRGRGEGIWDVVNEGWISLDQAGMIYVLVTASQGFAQPNDRFWAFQIWIDGQGPYRVIMGRQANDAPVLSATTGLTAGVHHVEVKWSAHKDVIQGYSDLFMMGVKK